MTFDQGWTDPTDAFAGRVDGESAPFSLSTVASSAPVLVQLSAQMRRARADTTDPGLRGVLSRVLDGGAPLSSLFGAGVLPAPPRDIPDALKSVVEQTEDPS